MDLIKATLQVLGEAPEDKEPASPDELSMALKQLSFIEYAAKELEEYLKNRGEFPEWMQNKLANVHDDIRGLHSYMGDHGEDDMKEETIIESHFKHGESVKCKESGMEGEVIDVGNPDDEKYYTVRRTDGQVMKYAPDELESLEEINEAKLPSEKEINKAIAKTKTMSQAVDILMKKFKMSKDEAELIMQSMMEEGGAGEEGTDELTKKYKKDTPMEEVEEAKEFTYRIHKDGKPLKKGGKTIEIYGVAKAKKMVDDLNKKHRGSKFTAHHVYKDGDDLDEGKLPPHLSKFFDKKGKLNKDAEERVKQGRKKRGLDPYTGKKVKSEKLDGRTRTFKEKLKRLGYAKTVKEDLDAIVNEARRGDSAKDVYFASYSSAISHTLAQAKKQGYEVDEDDVFREITTGQGKPSKGKTVRHTLKLTKNGKPQRKALHIQVYNRGTDKNTFELNFYIS